MVNLEGDIASYVVGMNINNESEISNLSDNFNTIHEALENYFECLWNKRGYYFLKMLGGEIIEDQFINRKEIEEYCSEALEDFASWYLTLRVADKNSGGVDKVISASGYFKPVADEVASIFIDGLLYVIKKPQDMITARTNPSPQPKEETSIDKIYKKADDMIDKFKQELKEMDLTPLQKIKEKINPYL